MKIVLRHAGPFFIAALFGVVSPVRAEPTTDTKHAVQALYAYGSCVVDQSPSRTRRVLSLVPGSKEERALLRSVADDRCINGHGGSQYLYFEPQMLRGAIAEAMLHLDQARGSKRKLANEPPPFPALSANDLARLSQEGQATLLALDVAQCLLSTDPQAVTALLAADPASPEEGQGFTKLLPNLGPCISDGKQVTLSKPHLRGVLAEAAYRSAFALANAPR